MPLPIPKYQNPLQQEVEYRRIQDTASLPPGVQEAYNKLLPRMRTDQSLRNLGRGFEPEWLTFGKSEEPHTGKMYQGEKDLVHSPRDWMSFDSDFKMHNHGNTGPLSDIDMRNVARYPKNDSYTVGFDQKTGETGLDAIHMLDEMSPEEFINTKDEIESSIMKLKGEGYSNWHVTRAALARMGELGLIDYTYMPLNKELGNRVDELLGLLPPVDTKSNLDEK